MKVFVTGASGFVGSHLMPYLKAQGIACIGSSQSQKPGLLQTGPLEVPQIDLVHALQGVHTIIHLAGFAHDKDTATDYRQSRPHLANVVATRNLLDAALKAGVRRIIYLSSVKAFGEGSFDHAVDEQETDQPIGFYGRSKLEAELLIRERLCSTTLDYVILRPSLIYGPGVKANFYNLIRLVDRAAVLPFGRINARRSMCYVSNLVDAIGQILRSQRPIRDTFYISDQETVEFRQVLRSISRSLDKSRWNLPVPKSFFYWVTRLLGRADIYQKLCSSFEVSVSKFSKELSWNHPYSLTEGIDATVSWYKKSQGRS